MVDVPGGYGNPYFEAFVWGLTGAESGHNYMPGGSYVNSSGAVGAYQVLDTNIPGWSRDATGKPVSLSTYETNHPVQDQVAQYQLLKYWGEHAKYNADGSMTPAQFQTAVLASAKDWNPNYPSYDPTYANRIWSSAHADQQTAPGGPPDHIFGTTDGATRQRWKLPGGVAQTQVHARKPGQWVSASGAPLTDPPTGTVKYAPPNAPSVINPNCTSDQPLGNWSKSTWVAVVQWINKYNDAAPTGTTGKAWYSTWIHANPDIYPRTYDNAMYLWQAVYNHIIVDQPSGIAIVDQGTADAGIGPTGLSGLLATLEKIFELLTSGAFWKRAGMFVLGTVILYFAVTRAFGVDPVSVVKGVV